jgi:hypothetical protein
MSDILTFMETVLKKPAKITEGIYFSKNTGKFFEIVKRKMGLLDRSTFAADLAPKLLIHFIVTRTSGAKGIFSTLRSTI